jgi:hypothetical protein
VKTLMITAQYLGSLGACASQLQRFEKLFPEGIVPTEKLATELTKAFNWEWAINYLLDDEHSHQTDAFIEVYYKTYVHQLDTAREKLHEGGCTVAAWEGYKTACQTFYDDVSAETARTFVRHFIAQGGRELLPREPRPTSNGVELTDEVLDALAEQAERGFEIGSLRLRGAASRENL